MLHGRAITVLIVATRSLDEDSQLVGASHPTAPAAEMTPIAGQTTPIAGQITPIAGPMTPTGGEVIPMTGQAPAMRGELASHSVMPVRRAVKRVRYAARGR